MKINIEKTEKYQEKIKEQFKELSTKEIYNTWGDTFDIECDDKNHVIIRYRGDQKIRAFKKICKMLLITAVYSAMDSVKKIKIRKKRNPRRIPEISPKNKKNIRALKFFAIGMVFVCFAASVIIVMCSYIGNRNFRETFYNASSIKVDSRVRVVHLSDLHSASYGKDNKKLTERVRAMEPDIIICTGDMVDTVDDSDDMVKLAGELAGIAPSYYIYGNNEVESIYDFVLNEKSLDHKFGFNSQNRDESELLNISDTFEQRIESAGMKVLKNEKDTIKIRTMNVDVYGVLTSNPSAFWSYSGKSFEEFTSQNPYNLKILAVHEPTIFEEFTPEFWADLIVCGHTHGGVTRIPILGPLYTHEGGLLPERGGNFVYGRYDAAGTPLIVSSGLDNSNIFRINNQPELVVIDINKF